MTTETPEILTIEQTAALLGIEKHHVSKLIASGIIPSIRLSPRVVRVPLWLLRRRLEEMAGAVSASP